MTDYADMGQFDRTMTAAELASERKPTAAPEPRIAPPANMAAEWQTYINARAARSEQRMLKIAMGAVGEVLAEERARLKAEFRAELERELAALRNEFLTIQLAEERAKRLKVVSPSGAMIA
jgi:hypothetical protein